MAHSVFLTKPHIGPDLAARAPGAGAAEIVGVADIAELTRFAERAVAGGAAEERDPPAAQDRRVLAAVLGCGLDQLGPCAGCREPTHRYGRGGSPLCRECRPGRGRRSRR